MGIWCQLSVVRELDGIRAGLVVPDGGGIRDEATNEIYGNSPVLLGVAGTTIGVLRSCLPRDYAPTHETGSSDFSLLTPCRADPNIA